MNTKNIGEYDAQPQVDEECYVFLRYADKYVWMNFWYQIFHVLKLNPKTVLEIGPGNKTVTNILQKEGIRVTTVDIDERLHPDAVASVTDLPFDDTAFDVVLCSEVLEHLPYDLFQKSLHEIRRVVKSHVVLGLPNAGGVFMLSFKFPLFAYWSFFMKLPFFWKKHKFNGAHFWETGKKGYLVSKIRADIQRSGFIILQEEMHSDDPAHYFFILEKQNTA